MHKMEVFVCDEYANKLRGYFRYFLGKLLWQKRENRERLDRKKEKNR